ncbi:MAG: SLATT domain-containing protein [Acidobacteriia bacterium]|nr:SLATT domain-containing protein [Terriglobia bacterium]
MPARSQDLTIPVDVRIGILGHWDAEQEPQLAASVQSIIRELDAMLDRSQPSYTLAQGLADGADRLMPAADRNQSPSVTHAAGRVATALRHFLRSFKTERSKQQFRAMFDAAKGDAAPNPDRARGQQAIRDCSVLIAIWNRDQVFDQASAAPLIAYALESAGRTVYWIDPASGKIKCYENDDGFIDCIWHLNAYNAERVRPEQIAAGVRDRTETLEALAYQCQLQPGTLEPLERRVIPHFVRASRLAVFWQNWHVAAGFFIYGMAAVAVANATMVSLFGWGRPWIFAEVGEMGAILLVVGVSEFWEWLRRWIDYRFLAERLRASVFLFVAGLACEAPSSDQPVSWMVRALDSIRDCSLRALVPADLRAVTQFIQQGWILNQRQYYDQRSREFENKHRLLAGAGVALFLATAIAALLHALHSFHDERLIEAAATILPAGGAAVAGFRAFREYNRTSLQYAAMKKSLGRLAADMDKINTPQALIQLLQDADHAIIREHQGWRFLVDVHEPRETI